MIRPSPRNDLGSERGFALVGTLALLLALYGGLRIADVPVLASGRALIRELDPLLFERFAAPPAADLSRNSQRDASEAEPEEPAPLDAQVAAAVDQVTDFFRDAAADEPVPVTREGIEGRGEGQLVRASETNPDGSRFESMFGRGTPSLPSRSSVARARPPISGTGGGLRLTEAAPPPSAMTATPVRQVSAQPGAEAYEVSVDAGEPVPDPVARTPFSADDLDRSAIATLQSWMRENPAELPVGVKVHLKYRPSFQTAVAQVRIGGRDVEIYLMLNPALEELHIVLVDGDQSVYLIDRGFQAEHRSLREGRVRRLNGEIVAVDSRAGAASSGRAQDFYDHFLSWWDLEKQNARE